MDKQNLGAHVPRHRWNLILAVLIILTSVLSTIPRSNAATRAPWVLVGGLKDPANNGDDLLHFQPGLPVTITRVPTIYGYPKYDSICGYNYTPGSWTVNTPVDAPATYSIARLNAYDSAIQGLLPDTPFELPNEGCFYISGTPSQAAIDDGWSGRSSGYSFRGGIYTPSTAYYAATIRISYQRNDGDGSGGGGGGGGGGSPPPPPPTPTPTPRPPTPTPTSNVDLAVAQSFESSATNPGGTVKVKLFVGNRGTTTATNVRVALTLGSELSQVSTAPSKGSFSNGTWSISSLSANEIASLVLTVKAASGTAGKTPLIRIVASSSQAERNSADNTKQYSVIVRSSSISTSTKVQPACPRPERARSFTGFIDAEGNPVNGFWQRVFRVPVMQVTITWNGLCFTDDGSIDTRYTSGEYYTVSVVGKHGWAASVVSNSRSCSISSALARCEQVVRLTPPSDSAVNLNFDIASEAQRWASRFGLSYTYRERTPQPSFPLAMAVARGGATYVAGGGDAALPNTTGDY